MEHSEASSKKSRKPYTLTKARESWSNDEHERFIKALQLYNRDWKKIETYVGTKTVVQIRSHAQKYFQKVLKSGVADAIPPPRAKRRASDPPHVAAGYPEAKHMRLLLEAPSRQGSGKEDDSDEAVQLQQGQGAQQAQQHQHQHQQHLHNHRQQAEMLEPPAQLESCRALISSQGLQQVYLFMASLFTQPAVDLPGMLQRLSTRDRHLLVVLLNSFVEELQLQQHPHSDQQQQLLPDDEHGDEQIEGHDLDQQDDPMQTQHPNTGSGEQCNGVVANITADTAPDSAQPAAGDPPAGAVLAAAHAGQDAASGAAAADGLVGAVPFAAGDTCVKGAPSVSAATPAAEAVDNGAAAAVTAAAVAAAGDQCMCPDTSGQRLPQQPDAQHCNAGAALPMLQGAQPLPHTAPGQPPPAQPQEQQQQDVRMSEVGEEQMQWPKQQQQQQEQEPVAPAAEHQPVIDPLAPAGAQPTVVSVGSTHAGCCAADAAAGEPGQLGHLAAAAAEIGEGQAEQQPQQQQQQQ